MTQQDLSLSPAESLSALVDGEASELELRRILKNIERDSALASTWSRYQLIGAALKEDFPPVTAPTTFSASVMAALDAEPNYGDRADQAATTGAAVYRSQSRLSSIWQTIGRTAVAASVAGALVVGGLQVLQDPAAPVMAPTMAETAPRMPQQELPSGINVPALSARTVAIQSDFESRPQESRRIIYVPHQQAAPIYDEDVSIYLNDFAVDRTESPSNLAPFTRVILLED